VGEFASGLDSTVKGIIDSLSDAATDSPEIFILLNLLKISQNTELVMNNDKQKKANCLNTNLILAMKLVLLLN
jgi:hypothetical protein